MSHEVETMFYAGTVPWHGLGKKIEGALTSAEALKEASLDWEVQTIPVYAGGVVLSNYQAIQRKTDSRIYGVVKKRYQPIQNKEAFSFFDLVTGEKKAFYHTAGSLRKGARVWILAKLPDSIGIKGDQIDKYILLSNSHDGTAALQMFWTPIRVVCMNTLRMAEESKAERFYSRHTANYRNRVEAARDVLGLADRFYLQWTEQATRLVQLQLPPAQMPLLLKAAFGYEQGVPMEEVYAPTRRAMETVENLFENGKGQDNPQIKGTKWAAYNAVTEYTDYYRKPRKNLANNRLNSAWFGSGARIKERAWDYLLAES